MINDGSVLFSVVVPCFNEEDYIFKLLNTLASQNVDAENFEVIVVDNNSTDRTAQVVWEFASKSEMNIKMVHEYMPGVSIARNSGANMSSGSTIVFLDADNTLSQEFLANLSGYISKNNCSAGSIRTMPDEPDIKGWAVFTVLEIIKMFSPRPFGKSFVERDVFIESGGFNEAIVLGENVDFLVRIKKLVKQMGGEFGHIRPGIKCSLRRFYKIGYMKILLPWMRAYVGDYTLNYKTMVDINKG